MHLLLPNEEVATSFSCMCIFIVLVSCLCFLCVPSLSLSLSLPCRLFLICRSVFCCRNSFCLFKWIIKIYPKETLSDPMKMGNKLEQPKLDDMVELMSILVCCCHPPYLTEVHTTPAGDVEPQTPSSLQVIYYYTNI